MSGKERVLMIRLGAIGNALVCIPAVRALRLAWPEAYLGMVVDPLTRQVLEGCPYLDELIDYNNRGAQTAGPGYVKFIFELQRRKPTHVIHFRRHLRSELMGLLSLAPVRVGFVTEAKIQLLTHKVPYIEGENVIELNLRLVRVLVLEALDRKLEYWPPQDTKIVDELLTGLQNEKSPLIVIHPAGSTQRERLWPHYGKLALMMIKELGASVVFIGAKSEEHIIQETAIGLEPDTRQAIGWPIPQVAELIRRAKLFIGTDSGPAHLADAVGTPGVILYAPHRDLQKQISKWKPEGPQYIALTPERDCQDCPEHPCPLSNQKECAASIPIEKVFISAGNLLKS